MKEWTKKQKKFLLVFSIVVISVISMSIGYYVLPNTYIIERVQEESGKYVAYFDLMQEYFKPFNETDSVTAHWGQDQLFMEHTVPNDQGMHHFHFGFGNEGFIKYIEQWRD